MPIENVSNPDRFLEIIKNKDVLCLYYWKLCGHCIRFAPIWEKVTNQYKDKIYIINVEADVVNKLASKYKLMAFPTVMVYKKGEKYAEFINNGRQNTEKLLHQFIHKHFAVVGDTNDPVKPKTKAKRNLKK